MNEEVYRTNRALAEQRKGQVLWMTIREKFPRGSRLRPAGVVPGAA